MCWVVVKRESETYSKAAHYLAIMDAAKRIRELRDAKDWTQKQLGEAAGWSEEYVRLIETGRRKPRKAIADLLKALGEEAGPIEEASAEIVRVAPRRRKEIEAHAEAHAMKHYADFVIRALPMPVTIFFGELGDVADTPVPVESGIFDDRIDGMTWCSDPAGPIYRDTARIGPAGPRRTSQHIANALALTTVQLVP